MSHRPIPPAAPGHPLRKLLRESMTPPVRSRRENIALFTVTFVSAFIILYSFVVV